MKKEKHYKVDSDKKIIYRYLGTQPSARDLEDIKMYVDCGYIVKWVKAPLTVAKMRAILKANNAEEELAAFDKAYKEKAVKGNTDFSETGFSKACKIYQDWKRKNKKTKKSAEEAEEE